MTLPELLITVMVMGLIAVALAAAITVTLRVQPGTSGRLNVARAEQNVALYMPTDLSSATDADADPGAAAPCGGCSSPASIGGSNALMLSWPEAGVTMYVSYVYRPAADGETYDIVRLACSVGGCSSVTVISELDGPPHADFVPGTTPVPSYVFDVTVPLEAGADEDDETSYEPASGDAHRIIVSIDGGGNAEGAGGGLNRISITAGGTELGDLEAESVVGPSFINARSECGGPITLIVDESISIGSAISDVKQGVRDFVNALAGTPTQVQIVRFESISSALGSTDWNHYFDMADPTDVDALTNTSTGHINALTSSWSTSGRGYTNWEEALFRTFYNESGQRLNDDGNPATSLPNIVVFFTDGVPNRDRLDPSFRTGTLPADPAAPDFTIWPQSAGPVMSQVAWNRANYIAGQFRSSTRLIGVGVGAGIAERSFAFNDPGYGLRYRSYSTDPDFDYRPTPSGSWTHLPYSTWQAGLVDNEKVLGNLVVGGDLTNDLDTGWVEADWNAGTGQWTNVADADLFVSPDWSSFGEALTTIALDQCGGTLTLQTSLPDGDPATANFTYESGGELVTTSRVARAAAFDVDIPDGISEVVTVTPQAFESPGYTATGWNCHAGGVDLTQGTDWDYVTPGTPADGITVTVRSNRATACTMTVVK